jgi:hypothetical protein
MDWMLTPRKWQWINAHIKIRVKITSQNYCIVTKISIIKYLKLKEYEWQ